MIRRGPGGPDGDFVCDLPERDGLEKTPHAITGKEVTEPAMEARPLRVLIELCGHGARGPRFLVRMNGPDGMVIVETSTEPPFDSARVLMSTGFTGKIEMWDVVRPFARIRSDIELIAGMTVSGGDAGIALRRYVERTVGGDFEGEGTSGARNESGRPRLVLQGAGDGDIANLDLHIAPGTLARSSARTAVAA
ncbi:hypothetical protein G5V57_05290 [Nordella sp. HKS 07]|uniref:hypothetical protein n=1 Tax=Nordella sp. HKS 07 TaxID=2712222 RepID=UPI0013E14202|nr:hypothetical protein [Nordella sp. HKS 07]QIG47198.1 hypothetical protein G5V57_05290 [Nordella sp. HKS 07]